MYLLFDIGATNTRVAISKSGSSPDEVLILKTPETFKDGMAMLKAAGERLLDGRKPKAVAAGLAGPLDYKTGKLIHFQRPDWQGKSVKGALKKAFNCPIHLENDAALAAIGEANFGAGKGKKIVAYLTVSTGIGGARIVDGHLDRNTAGFEPRLQLLQGHPLKNFGSLSSGSAIQALYKKPGEKLENRNAWREIELWLTMGFNNAIVLWSPEVLVVGGPVAFNKHLSFKRIEKRLQKNLKILKPKPRIIKSRLRQLSGIYGALALIKQNRPQ